MGNIKLLTKWKLNIEYSKDTIYFGDIFVYKHHPTNENTSVFLCFFSVNSFAWTSAIFPRPQAVIHCNINLKKMLQLRIIFLLSGKILLWSLHVYVFISLWFNCDCKMKQCVFLGRNKNKNQDNVINLIVLNSYHFCLMCWTSLLKTTVIKYFLDISFCILLQQALCHITP